MTTEWASGKGRSAESGSGRAPGAASGRPRLASIVYFRAVAILLIVAGHAYGLAGINLGDGGDYTLSNLVKGATALFVFISGFLFDYVFSARYNYRSFLFERATKLLIPYVVLTVLAGLMFSNWAGGGLTVRTFVRAMVLGDAFQAYWYIPFILLMFALTPLYRRFTDLRTSHQVTIIIAGAILGGLVQRPVGNFNALQSVVFYLPIYLSGLFLSLHRKTLLPALRRYWPVLLLAALGVAGIQALTGQSGNMHKPFFALGGFELMGFQKLLLSFGLFGVFAMFSSTPRIVGVIADTSFAIFFLHPFLLKLLHGTTVFRVTHLPWLDLVIVVAAIVTACVLIALVLRALLRANSKYFIGY